MILADKQLLSHPIDFFTIGGHRCTLDALLARNVTETAEGNVIAVRQTGRGTAVDEALVLEGDIDAENGIIHALDSVPFSTLSQAFEAHTAAG